MAGTATNDEAKEKPQLFLYGDATYKLDDIIKAAEQDYNKRYYYSRLDTKNVNSDRLNNAINEMLEGLEEGWIGYNPSSGNFVISGNRKDITDDKDHYYGMAAWYLKHMIIQNLTPYDKEKEEEEEAIKHGKVKYDGLGSLQNYFRKTLVGNGLTKLNFINLDKYNENTGTRAVTNRTAYVNKAILEMINGFEDYFYGYTNKLKDDAINKLKGLQEKIIDKNLDINEFPYFEKVLGSNLSKDESNPITWAELFNTTWNGKSDKLNDTTEYDYYKKVQAFNQWVTDKRYNINEDYEPITIDLNRTKSKSGKPLEKDTIIFLNKFLDKFMNEVIEKKQVKKLLYTLAEKRDYLQEVLEDNISDYNSEVKKHKIDQATNEYALEYLLSSGNIKNSLKKGITQNNIKMIYDERENKIYLYWVGSEKGFLKNEFDKEYTNGKKDYYYTYYEPALPVALEKKDENDELRES